ncbi:MAG: FkbM family methyltransferase [Roseimicrobium sp.]
METTFLPGQALSSSATPTNDTAVGTPSLRQSVAALATRFYPLYSGCGTVGNHPVLERLTGPNQEKVWARVVGGKIIAPLNDHVGRAAFFCGDLDPKVTWVCRQIIRPGDTVLDIGANIGVTTVAMASMVGATGRVHSFEPNPELQLMLRKVLEENRLGNVTLHSMALGPHESQMELRVPRSNLGMGSLVRHGNPDDAIYTVPVRRLNDIIVQENITAIRMIKIDVEGFEADVFHGAQEVLNFLKPEAILFELNQEAGAFGEQAVVQILHEAGYKFLAIPQCKLRMKLERMPLEATLQRAGNDYLAIRPQADGQLLRRLRVA